jgi:hypothetical protein
MTPTKSETTVAEELLAAAKVAKEEMISAAETAREKVKNACDQALYDLDRAGPTDRRQLNGSYRWDRSEGIEMRTGKLEVGQAKRGEQIIGLIDDVATLKDVMTEQSNRMTTLRELILEVKDACTVRIDALKDDTRKDKIRNQQYVIGLVVSFVVTVALSILFGYAHFVR